MRTFLVIILLVNTMIALWFLLHYMRYAKRKYEPTKLDSTHNNPVAICYRYLRQITPNGAIQRQSESTGKQDNIFADENPKVVPSEEIDNAFTNNLLDVDLEMDYSSISGFDELGLDNTIEAQVSAKGVSFDDLDNLTKVITIQDNSSSNLAQAVGTAKELEHTELYEQIVAQIKNGEAIIASMIASFEHNQSHSKIEVSEKLNDFNINQYL